VEAAPDLTPLIHTARQVNDAQPHFVVNKLESILNGLDGKTITVFGLAYKPDVDDLRESPAIEIVQLLSEKGAIVKAYEPFKPDYPLKHGSMVKTLEEALQGTDALALLVGHQQLRELDPQDIQSKTDCRILLDTVNGWDCAAWSKAGFETYQLGVSRCD
jgi:UDP-N-acetyl-D-mannosaminuronic acid dehydrogenase